MSVTSTGPRTVAWFHCFAGIAGDMALGSLIDAGAPVEGVTELLQRLPIGGWSLDIEPVLRGGIAASHAVVGVSDSVVIRTHAHIVGLVEEARLPPRVTQRALAVFGALAVAEARLHRRPVDQVHFHEVGGHDTIVDVVGTAIALELLGVDDVTASPVATGLGMVRAAHGMLPNPAPAVVSLLEGVPTWGRDVAVELTTPTGAAILAALCSHYGPMPAMRISSHGFGAGTRELPELPNCTQVVLGAALGSDVEGGYLGGGGGGHGHGHGPGNGDPGSGQPVMLLEANIDDATGEQLAHAVATLLDSGAHDAWLTPVIMKKGRPGSTVHVLCDPVRATQLRSVLRAEVGTLGVRGSIIERWPVPREQTAVEVDGHVVRIKVSRERAKAEYEDAARVAKLTGLPLREVTTRAEARWRDADLRRQSATEPVDRPNPGSNEPA